MTVPRPKLHSSLKIYFASNVHKDKDMWANGDIYESYVGRWSRLVALRSRARWGTGTEQALGP
ncbi:MAG TPA: hypothetical protein VI278_18535 [Nitrososphaeraceae archaeon]